MEKKNPKILEYKKELLEVFSSIKGDKKLMAEFLIDILTPAEFDDLALRWQLVKRLYKGDTHRAVAGELGLGLGKVMRGSRELRNKKGGFNLILKKLSK
ncbi:MAG: Trp family transcriptional regulator [Candidatus Paceibacterota bacterium]